MTGACERVGIDRDQVEDIVAGCVNPAQLDGFVVPDDKLTPNGGAVAIGHPFGATGGRYVLTLATELRERNARYGVIGVCIGSGQGVAVVLENPRAS